MKYTNEIMENGIKSNKDDLVNIIKHSKGELEREIKLINVEIQ